MKKSKTHKQKFFNEKLWDKIYEEVGFEADYKISRNLFVRVLRVGSQSEKTIIDKYFKDDTKYFFIMPQKQQSFFATAEMPFEVDIVTGDISYEKE